jgi:hypothetical protein
MGRFPAFYRENPAILEPLVDAAEEMILDLRALLSRTEERIDKGVPALWDRLLDRPEAIAGGRRSRMEGTAAAVAAWLEGRFGALPAIWSAMEARPHPAGGISFRSTWFPSAVVAWEKTAFPEAPGDISIPEDLLPAGVPVRAVVLARLPGARRPRTGERLPGEIVWSRPGTTGPEPDPAGREDGKT